MSNSNLPDGVARQILLQSSGELSPAEAEALQFVLKHDAEAAAYADFIQNVLPAAATTPRDFAAEACGLRTRDFAAEAIASVLPEAPKVLQFPVMWKLGLGAAAAVALAASSFWFGRSSNQNTLLVSPSPPAAEMRLTAQISGRLDALEAELAQSPTRRFRPTKL